MLKTDALWYIFKTTKTNLSDLIQIKRNSSNGNWSDSLKFSICATLTWTSKYTAFNRTFIKNNIQRTLNKRTYFVMESSLRRILSTLSTEDEYTRLRGSFLNNPHNSHFFSLLISFGAKIKSWIVIYVKFLRS